MKHLLLTILSFFAAFSFAQNANWGTGLPITATVNGTSISVSVYDPILGSNQTSSIIRVAMDIKFLVVKVGKNIIIPTAITLI